MSLAAFGGAVLMAEAQPATTTRWSRIDSVQGFAGWRAQLQHMADQGATPINHMCIVVATYSRPSIHDTTIWGYLYWREAHRLYTLDRSDEPMSDLSIFKEPLDLRTDVVRTERDIHGSTFLVTRAWVNDVLRHCAMSGAEVVLRKSHA